MKIIEILLPKSIRDKGLLPPKTTKEIDVIQQRMNGYVDKIMDPSTSPNGKDFLRSKLRDDYDKLKVLLNNIEENYNKKVTEAVHKLPLSNSDFEAVKILFNNPIPAIVSDIYLSEVIIDDELNSQIESFKETEPNRDIRPLIVEWFRRVMPDQMHRFGQEVASQNEKLGILSPLHGYDPHMYKGTNDPITGNAYGMR